MNNLCTTCIHRAKSKAAVAEFLELNPDGKGIVCNPAPRVECKDHEGYGCVPEKSLDYCTDYKRALHYVLENKIPLVEPDVLKWAAWFDLNRKQSIVNKTRGSVFLGGRNVGYIEISTVFLGIDHSFDQGPPILFETMVFGGVLDGECERCSTWEAAEQMHEKFIEKVKSATNKARNNI